MTAWIVISCILGVIWLLALFGFGGWGLFTAELSSEGERKEFFTYFSAIMAGTAVFVFFHWIVLLLAIPVFLAWGIWNGIKLLIKKPWRDL